MKEIKKRKGWRMGEKWKKKSKCGKNEEENDEEEKEEEEEEGVQQTIS